MTNIFMSGALIFKRIVMRINYGFGVETMNLYVQGFYGVVDIAGGYSTWTQNGLPTD